MTKVQSVSKCHMKGSFRCPCVFLNDFTSFLMMSCLLAIKSFDSNLFVFRLWFYDVSDKRLNLSIKEKKDSFRQLRCLDSRWRQRLIYHKLRRDSPACSHVVVFLCTNARLTRCFESLHVQGIHIYFLICNTVQKLYAGEEKML